MESNSISRRLTAAISDLANALQTAVLIAFELETVAFEHFNHVGELQAALRRAVDALRRLNPE